MIIMANSKVINQIQNQILFLKLTLAIVVLSLVTASEFWLLSAWLIEVCTELSDVCSPSLAVTIKLKPEMILDICLSLMVSHQ